MNALFEHENMPAYQAALTFAKWSEAVLERTPKNRAAYSQLDQGRLALSCKIAAAHGKLPSGERATLWTTAQRIALETAACLDLLFQNGILSREELQHGKEVLRGIVAALRDWDWSTGPAPEDTGELRVAEAALKSD
jgi:hypothetical protein